MLFRLASIATSFIPTRSYDNSSTVASQASLAQLVQLIDQHILLSSKQSHQAKESEDRSATAMDLSLLHD